jgi:hypothetical protein
MKKMEQIFLALVSTIDGFTTLKAMTENGEKEALTRITTYHLLMGRKPLRNKIKFSFDSSTENKIAYDCAVPGGPSESVHYVSPDDINATIIDFTKQKQINQ